MYDIFVKHLKDGGSFPEIISIEVSGNPFSDSKDCRRMYVFGHYSFVNHLNRQGVSGNSPLSSDFGGSVATKIYWNARSYITRSLQNSRCPAARNDIRQTLYGST